MTANLLARTRLFSAGIARSGAYNRQLTPFGFQSEERHFWEASETYAAMSPFNHADKIVTPLLLIHGEADPNPGTYPMQSERLFAAIKGLGGTARLVVLPGEGHAYRARESIMHVLAEQDAWLETHVKNAKLAGETAALGETAADEASAPLPPTYRALLARSVGDQFRDVAEIAELPLRAPAAGEVLVKVMYAGVNGGCETFRARGEFAFASNREASEFALGAEGVGVVAAIGDGVESVQIGDAVCFVGGGFSEYTLAKAQMLWKVPAPTAEMAALRISALTACAMMDITGKVRAGETVLVTAAAGGAGHFAVQFAKMAGCTVIGTCSSAEKARALCKLGTSVLRIPPPPLQHHRTGRARVPRVRGTACIDLPYPCLAPLLQAAITSSTIGRRTSARCSRRSHPLVWTWPLKAWAARCSRRCSSI